MNAPTLKIICDTREQAPLDFSRWPDVVVEVGGLPSGDYALKGLEIRAAVERKSIDDLAGSLTSGRERFEAELTRARGYDLFAIVAECTMQDVAQHRYRSKALPHALLQTLFAYQARFKVPTIWAGSREGAAYAVHSLLSKYLAEARKGLEAIVKAHNHAA
jgi:ERCC4-type nuclease